MYCRECGNEIEADSTFCSMCGIAVPSRVHSMHDTEAPPTDFQEMIDNAIKPVARYCGRVAGKGLARIEMLPYADLVLPTIRKRFLIVLAAMLLLCICYWIVLSRHSYYVNRRVHILSIAGVSLKVFAGENRNEYYPPLNKAPGSFALDRSIIDEHAFINSEAWAEIGDEYEEDCYIYLGYAVTTPEEMDSFVRMYEAFVNGQFSGEEDYEDPVTGKTLYRLKEGVARHYVSKVESAGESAAMGARIPIMFEKRSFTGKALVLFMDGHVQTVRAGEDTGIDAVHSSLSQLDAIAKDGASAPTPTEGADLETASSTESTPNTGISFLDIFLNESPQAIAKKLASSEFCLAGRSGQFDQLDRLIEPNADRSAPILVSLTDKDLTFAVYDDTIGQFSSDIKLFDFCSSLKVYLTRHVFKSPFGEVRLYSTQDKRTTLSLVIDLNDNQTEFVKKLIERYGEPTREEGGGFIPVVLQKWTVGNQAIHYLESFEYNRLYYFNVEPIKTLLAEAQDLRVKKEAEPTPAEKALEKF